MTIPVPTVPAADPARTNLVLVQLEDAIGVRDTVRAAAALKQLEAAAGTEYTSQLVQFLIAAGFANIIT